MTSPTNNKEHWYVVYTKPRWEKKVVQELEQIGILTFLPLRKTLKQWSDRKKWVEEPLFKSYVFLKITDKQYYEALNVRGLVSFVKQAGKPAKVPIQQIEAVKQYLGTNLEEVIEIPKLSKGERIEVTRGLLIGLTGYLVDLKGKHKVLIEIEAINENIIINIPIAHLRKIE